METVYRASFLTPSSAEAGVYHLTEELSRRYLTDRLGNQKLVAGTGLRVKNRRIGPVLYTFSRRVYGLYQRVALDLSQPYVYTVVCWLANHASIHAVYSLDEVASVIRGKRLEGLGELSQINNPGQSWFLNRTKRLVFTVTHERVDKYIQLFELVRMMAQGE